MTELEWLKDQSGLSEEEMKAMQAVAGSAKFVSMLQKIIASNSEAQTAKTEAEEQRLSFERRYNDEFVPEMRKVTQDALSAQSRAAAAEAALKQAREYGIVPPETAAAVVDPPRAPGSPNSDGVTRDDFGRFSQSQSRTMIALNDLNADHFRLFGSPLGDTQGLVDEVYRQHTLGNKQYTLKQAWETRHNVAAKRDEMVKADRQKEIDAAVAADRKVQAEKRGSNPNVRSGQTSRFSGYTSTDTSKEPWKAPHSKTQAHKSWRDAAVSKVREATA